MTYDQQRKKAGRQPCTLVELTLPCCSRRYGDGVCTAALGVTGSQQCFNTRETCQDSANFDPVDRTFLHADREVHGVPSSQPPLAPILLSATAAATPTRVLLVWTDRSASEDGFYIERKTTGDFARVDTVDANVTTYTDLTVAAGILYTYRIVAFKTGVGVGISNEISVTTFPIPAISVINAIVFNGSVAGMVSNGVLLYIGGSFTTINDGLGLVSRTRLACIDLATGRLTSWAPTADAIVETMCLDSSGNIYFGGDFTVVNGSTRRHIASVDSSGTLRSWDAGLVGGNRTTQVRFNSGSIWATGDINFAPNNNFFGKFNTTTGALDPTFQPGSITGGGGDPARSIAFDPATNTVYMGGSISNPPRNGVCAYDMTSGALRTFSISTSTADDLLFYSGSLYAVHTTGVRKYDGVTGAQDSAFLPTFTGRAFSIALGPGGTNVYLFGVFTNVNGSARAGSCGLNAANGALTPFDVNPSSSGNEGCAAGIHIVSGGGNFLRIGAAT